MRVNFYATLRAAAGVKSIDVPYDTQTTVRTMLQMITNDKPNLATEIWESPGKLNDYIHVFVNGREMRYLPDGLDTLLKPNDTLDVFPPVGGG